MDLLIKNAVIIDPNSNFNNEKNDILIEKGIITKIAKSIANNNNYTEFTKDNLHISTGWFDTSVCFGEPGYEERETIDNGLIVAAKSGFTAIAINSNTNPKIDNKAAVEFLTNKAKYNPVNIYPIGNLTSNGEGKDLAELFDMQNSGAIAFGDFKSPISNPNLLKIALQYTQNFNGLTLSFPQDNAIARDGLANEDHTSTRVGLKGIPNLAEELQVSRDLFLLEYTGGKLHIPTISTAKSVKLIKEAKKKGLNITCSVAAHNLILSDEEIASFDSNYKVSPPLRTQKDIKALVKGVQDGTIDIITSDHTPIDIEHKKVEFNSAKNGTIGLETIFGALNTILDKETIIKCISTNPRKIFGLDEILIKEGEYANLTFFETEKEHTFSLSNIISTSKNSIFLNKKLKGTPIAIFSNNELVTK